MNKNILALGVGIAAGQWLAPRVQTMLNIPASTGFGMDDMVTIGLQIVGVLMAEKFI
jgi:hypothetical protein